MERERELIPNPYEYAGRSMKHAGRSMNPAAVADVWGFGPEPRSSEQWSPIFCGSCLACFLKLLNFLQTFVGVSIVIYSIWILTRWNRSQRLGLDLDDLPAPWFICALIAAGVLLCLVAITGHIAAEVFSGCCL